jgi:tRNA 2-thiocytidine biosynthesis protein TtcA
MNDTRDPLVDASPDAEFVKLENRLLRKVSQATKTFEMLEAGDRVMVCLSGGKDSWVLLHLLRKLTKRLPFAIELIGVNLDQGHPGFEQRLISDYLEAHGYTYRMLHQDTLTVVKSKIAEGKTYCSLCSRLRRGILYTAAGEVGATKLALGHHRDDILETALLNLFFGGKLATMPPKFLSDDGQNTVIRPLALCAEEEIAAYAAAVGFPILPCNLCGSQENLQRQQMKALLTELDAKYPKLKGTMLAALGNVNPTHLLDLPLLERLQQGAAAPVSSP